MDNITIDKITTIGTEINPEIIIHPTSVAYIQQLLTPYAEAIEPSPIYVILEWIPGDLGNRLLERVTAILDKEAYVVKNTIISFIIEVILGAAIVVITDVIELGDSTVLPWDIQTVIGSDDDLSRMFATDDNNRLPVTVTIGPNTFTHMLSEEFTMGLLLFSDPAVGNVDFNITMFGTKFTSDYIVPLDREAPATHDGVVYRDNVYYSRFIQGDFANAYSVSIANRLYTFDTTDFMQGLSTGALWAGVDHHRYWKDLVQHSADENGDGVHTLLNF